MSTERFWVVVLAVTTFLAGSAGGVLLGLRLDPHYATGPYPAYYERLVRAYDLDEERADRLRQILAAYDEEIEALKARHVDELEPELVAAGEVCHGRIRRFVIPAERRDEFDRLARGDAAPAALAQ